MNHSSTMNRRAFLQRTASTAAGVFFISKLGARGQSANGKLNLGIIGVANRAGENLNGVAGENIVALCDIDDRYLAKAAQRFPKAATYYDFRKMLERKDLDGVVVSTTDHTHAVASVLAMEGGRHVYCEKPLTLTVSEARIVAETARKHKRTTQMGTQIHAEKNYRRVVELVRAGAVGPIREVHNWVGAVWSGYGKVVKTEPVPPDVKWDLWLGPAESQPYSPMYHPAGWRGYWAFGGGALADMACHHMDLPFWALELGAPTSIEAEGPEVHPEFAPPWLIVRYEFPARGSQPPVKLTWYNGDKRPPLISGDPNLSKWGAGTLFVGEKGMLLADYGKHVLLPEKDFANYQRPAPSIPDSIGHHAEWIQACKTGGPTTCNFTYAANLTEAVLLGNVAYRSGKKIEWDAKNLRAKNAPEAKKFIQHRHRKGWSF